MSEGFLYTAAGPYRYPINHQSSSCSGLACLPLYDDHKALRLHLLYLKEEVVGS